MYRSILGANGYDISNMNLKVFPISVADGDFNTLSINNRTPMVELTATSGHHVAHCTAILVLRAAPLLMYQFGSFPPFFLLPIPFFSRILLYRCMPYRPPSSLCLIIF